MRASDHDGGKSGADAGQPAGRACSRGTGSTSFAAKAGAPTNPDWYHNLVAHPDVAVEFGDERFDAVAVPVTGRRAGPPLAAQVAAAAGFADYEKNAGGRVIPVVELRRQAEGSPTVPHRAVGTARDPTVGRRAADYYLSDLGRAARGRGPGRWAGPAAPRSRARGRRRRPRAFRRVAGGSAPGDRRAAHRVGVDGAVAAYDLTFSAPKSASVLFGLGGEDVARQVVRRTREAVAGARGVSGTARCGAVRREGRRARW